MSRWLSAAVDARTVRLTAESDNVTIHRWIECKLRVICAVAPIGLLLGRLANFVNGELWGRQADVPWVMIFPRAGPIPRHPSQLYER
jgi:prolipoprotein diacylglyceryltransferase